MTGCAKFPETRLPPASQDRLTVTLTYAAALDPSFYYFIAIDDDGNPDTGPLPALTRPWGNGWVVPESRDSRCRFFVQYLQNTAAMFRLDTFVPPFTTSYLGAPLQTIVLQPDRLRIVIDLRHLFTDFPIRPQRIELNFISVDELILDPTYTGVRNIDALGPTGNDFLSIPLTSTQTFRNGQGGLTAEGAGDATLDPLDLTNWEVSVLRGG
ncbi:MAG: hypothetical protein NZ959_01965 [Armatimonadetes bacterium]|nr:hypothetical protein [Armatimonadota bacterium]MDW8120826.1 hypothetical protein [Armatimonadota bacterium]